jgi:hypothetical protein
MIDPTATNKLLEWTVGTNKNMRRDQLQMGYFDKLDNGFLKKYKKNYICVILPLDL